MVQAERVRVLEERLQAAVDELARAALARRLGMPEGSQVVVILMDPVPEEWQGYQIEKVGRLVPKPNDAPIWPWEWRAEDGDDVFVQIWRQRARFGDSPLALETLWRPGESVEQRIIGIENPFEIEDALRLAKMAPMARRPITSKGRPSEVEKHYAECVEAYGRLRSVAVRVRQYSNTAVAAALTPKLAEQTMKDRVKRFREAKLQWPPPWPPPGD